MVMRRRRLLRSLALGACLVADPWRPSEAIVPSPPVELIEPEMLVTLLASAACQMSLLDVRDPAGGATWRGKLPGAVAAPYGAAGWRREVGGLPGMLPPPAELEALLTRLGIGDAAMVAVYGSGTSAYDVAAVGRVAWTLAIAGVERPLVLVGGYRAWAAAGLASGGSREASIRQTAVRLRWQRQLLARRADVAAAVGQPGTVLLDLRTPRQHHGLEVAVGVASAGTLPGARNLPYTRLVDPRGRLLVDGRQLVLLLRSLGIRPEDRLITFCNTGHWAALGWLLLHGMARHSAVALYDGSMAEWSRVPGAQVVTGGAP